MYFSGCLITLSDSKVYSVECFDDWQGMNWKGLGKDQSWTKKLNSGA
jgi:hypothetical protein